MKKIFLKTILFLMLVLTPASVLAMGHVDVGVRIPLPPPLLFPVPPWLVVIPETDVYAVPDIHITTEIGHTIKAHRHFTDKLHQTGAPTITSSAGKDINGSSAAFLNMKLN